MNLSADNLNFLLAFLGGIGVSLTPCVFPLIPITVSYIGIKSEGSRRRGFVLSLIYVTGIAVTYSILGMLASLAGIFFGSISSHPVTYIFVGAAVIFFGLSMLDLFAISLPMIKLRSISGKKGYISAFFLGISSGLIVGPCLTPVLASILSYLATKKNILYGMSLLISFAYGMGVILILAGTFSSFMLSLPKSGKWMVYIKKAGAVVLLCAGAYFVFIGIKGLEPIR